MVSGTWNIIARTPVGEQKATFVFTVDAGALRGHMVIGERWIDIFDAKVDGKKIAWKVSVDQPMPRTLEFDGTWTGDSMSGRAKAGMFGSSPFTGTRAGAARGEAPTSMVGRVASLVRKVLPTR